MVAVPPPSSARTVGAAIVMTVLSSRSMISATRTMARTAQRRRNGSACGGAATGWGATAAGAEAEEEDVDTGTPWGRGAEEQHTNSVRDEHRTLRTAFASR